MMPNEATQPLKQMHSFKTTTICCVHQVSLFSKPLKLLAASYRSRSILLTPIEVGHHVFWTQGVKTLSEQALSDQTLEGPNLTEVQRFVASILFRGRHTFSTGQLQGREPTQLHCPFHFA
jgi:hypothetical protein